MGISGFRLFEGVRHSLQGILLDKTRCGPSLCECRVPGSVENSQMLNMLSCVRARARVCVVWVWGEWVGVCVVCVSCGLCCVGWCAPHVSGPFALRALHYIRSASAPRPILAVKHST